MKRAMLENAVLTAGLVVLALGLAGLVWLYFWAMAVFRVYDGFLK